MHTPDWTCLPHDPQGFFELDDDFDRKDLKRAYNRLLKQFKPEKHPEEFKRLRSAFEDLEEQLRYGRRARIREVREQYQWNPQADSTSTASSPTATTTAPTITQLLERSSVKQVYKQISDRSEKSPYDFFALAMMSDLVQSDRSMFFRWLATGLKQFPDDFGLGALLRAHLASPNLPIESLPQTLLTFSKVVNSDEFYFFTERAWKRLLRESDFQVFQRTLANCENNLTSFAITNKLTFYLTMLRIGIWKADAQWTQKTFRFVSDHELELGPHAEYELEMINCLFKYRNEHSKIIGDNKTRKDIHRAIEAWCSMPDAESDSLILDIINRLSNDAQLLLEAFPVKPVSDDVTHEMTPQEQLFFIWQHVCNDVAERNGIVLDNVDYEDFTQRLYRLLKDLENDWDSSRLPMICGWGSLLLYPIIAIPSFIYAVAWANAINVYLILPAILLVMGFILAYHFVIRPLTIDRLIQSLYLKRVFSYYKGNWRGRFIQLIEAAGVNAQDLNQGIYMVIAQRHKRLNASTLLCEYVPQDVGLSFFASVNQFRT